MEPKIKLKIKMKLSWRNEDQIKRVAEEKKCTIFAQKHLIFSSLYKNTEYKSVSWNAFQIKLPTKCAIRRQINKKNAAKFDSLMTSLDSDRYTINQIQCNERRHLLEKHARAFIWLQSTIQFIWRRSYLYHTHTYLKKSSSSAYSFWRCNNITMLHLHMHLHVSTHIQYIKKQWNSKISLKQHETFNRWCDSSTIS